MVIRCLSFGSLWWLRPGDQTGDPLRYSAHAAAFNTTGFQSGSRERRLWIIAGVVRINLGMHPALGNAEDCGDACFDTRGPERRGEWNRLLLGRKLKQQTAADKLLLCLRSEDLGRIDFDISWHDTKIQVLAASALRGSQETLVLASPGAQFQTEEGSWEVTWNGTEKR
jgi:hypothetical protein